MRKLVSISLQALMAILLAGAGPADAQQSFIERFTSHNAAMSKIQPAFITPIVGADPRLLQYARASFSKEYTATGTETVNYGNARGGGIISGDRFEFDFVPPPYIQHNSTATDGFGDTSALVKYRIASGDAQHGNFAVAAMLSHSFATGSAENGARTDVYSPTLAGGYAFFHRFDALASLGGTMPTGKIAAQGRTIVSNALLQMHAARQVWFEVEDNATFYFAGSHDGQMQNFILPGAFYVVRNRDWKPTHPFFIFDSGMQIATSGFHTYNHNLISEMRLLF